MGLAAVGRKAKSTRRVSVGAHARGRRRRPGAAAAGGGLRHDELARACRAADRGRRGRRPPRSAARAREHGRRGEARAGAGRATPRDARRAAATTRTLPRPSAANARLSASTSRRASSAKCASRRAMRAARAAFCHNMTPWAAAATAGGGPRLRVVHVGKGAGARDVAAGGAEQRQAARGRRAWLAGPVYDAGETGAMPASPTASRSCPRTRDRGPATADAHSGARGGILLITRTNDSSAQRTAPAGSTMAWIPPSPWSAAMRSVSRRPPYRSSGEPRGLRRPDVRRAQRCRPRILRRQVRVRRVPHPRRRHRFHHAQTRGNDDGRGPPVATDYTC